jgi:hypothetical protein
MRCRWRTGVDDRLLDCCCTRIAAVNPQTFVTDIFAAKPADYRTATQHVFHSAAHASYITLPVVEN